VTIPAEGRSLAQDGVQGGNRRQPAVVGPPWLALIPAAVTFGVTLFEIGRPSFWQDETSTLADTQRTFPQMLALLGHIDAVHGVYYALMWIVVRVAGTSELAVRLPSAVGMAVAAGGVTLLGQRLVSARAGLAVGLVFAAIPQVSWYGQDARETSLVTAVATVATYIFVRAMEAPGAGRRRWLAGYGISLAILGLLNLFALLLIPGHGLTLAVHVRRKSRVSRRIAGADGANERAATRPLVMGWLVSAAAAVVVASPVAVLGVRQQRQIAWIARPGLRTLIGVEQMIGQPAVFGAVLIVTAAGVTFSALRGRSQLRTDWPGRLIAVCVPWLILPPTILLAGSLLHPVYLFRYVVFCIPAAALLVGTALAALGRIAGTLALVLIVVLVLPAQAKVRGPDGHGENLRGISNLLAEHARPGDAVLFASFYERKISVAYPAGFRPLRDISLGKTALQIAEPTGMNAPTAVISSRLAKVSGLWLIKRLGHREPSTPGEPPGTSAALPPLRQLGFRLYRQWTITGYRIDFYLRGAGASQ
jgi:mannosyltransferase